MINQLFTKCLNPLNFCMNTVGVGMFPSKLLHSQHATIFILFFNFSYMNPASYEGDGLLIRTRLLYMFYQAIS